MFLIDSIIFYGSVLILLGIVSRKFSSRFGVPVLVLFLLLGMVAGSEGIGGIAFDDYEVAHSLGTLALVVILFDGGLRTGLDVLRLSWKPSFILATAGVLVTAVMTGMASAWILGLTPLEGLLLGSIVASTDAAAVFSILRSQGINLNERLKGMLEVESGSNDPMAVLLTIGCIEVLLGQRSIDGGLLLFFVQQMGVGLAVGWLLGRLAVSLVNWIRLDTAGLYPVLVVTLGLLIYGLAAMLGGSGFLAVYVAGIVIGNHRIVFQRGTFVFHDGLAWISQISMFVLLGLLSFPSQLIEVAFEGFVVGAVLMFVARPLAVHLLLVPFGFTMRELFFTSWVGLKGAVPIILAIYPLLFGIPEGMLIFNVVFFVVLISALLQGWSLPPVARMLGLQLSEKPEPPITLEISSLQHVDADIVDYEITENSAAAHLRISELELPPDTVIALVTRGEEILPARGATILLPGDHVFVILRSARRDEVDDVFRSVDERDVPLRTGVYVPGKLRLQQLDDLYDIQLDGDPMQRIQDFLKEKLGKPLEEGSFYEFRYWRLYVHDVGVDGMALIGIEELSTPGESKQSQA